MITMNDQIWNGYVETLSQTSFDDANSIYLVSDLQSAINFDKFKKQYVTNKYQLNDNLGRSVDALYFNDKEIFLIEFKNQAFKDINKNRIRNKASDSMIILNDVFNNPTHMRDLRKESTFVLVYREDKTIASRSKIGAHISQKANQKPPGHDSYKFLYFYCNQYEILTESEFTKYLTKMNIT